MRIGFTGTQKGMSDTQRRFLETFLSVAAEKIPAFHHGDCVGADAQAHDLAVKYLGEDRVWIHPPENPKKRAFCRSPHVLPTQNYIDRNHEIVDVTDGMIAAPETQQEVLRSGTWATIRYAKRKHKPLRIL